MTNIVQLDKSRGFTRMDNELYEALIGADLSGRELRVALAVHRLTAGFNQDESRITASVISDMSGIRREHVSRMLCELLRQRVIYRVGGSKGPIGFSPVSEWKIDEKVCAENGTKDLAQSAENGTKVVPISAHYKDSKDNTTPNGVVTPAKPVEEKPAKAKSFGLADLLADNPHSIPEQLLADWITTRKAKRAALTPTAWKRLNNSLAKCKAAGFTAEYAVETMVSKGWQTVEVDWLKNSTRSFSGPQSVPAYDANDTSWAIGLEQDLF
ncbi:replication protein [Pseudomonas aeruginosa]|nr:replication protein [Pseudomonas aeruginosa]